MAKKPQVLVWHALIRLERIIGRTRSDRMVEARKTGIRNTACRGKMATRHCGQVGTGGTWMCEAMRSAIKEAYEEAYKEGEARGFALALRLIEAGRLDDLNRATEDVEYRRKLMKEFGID